MFLEFVLPSIQFSGEPGDKFKSACATFCRSQSYALETLRVRQRKDQKLAIFLQVRPGKAPQLTKGIADVRSERDC